MDDSTQKSVLKSSSSAGWRAIATFSILTLLPISFWCRHKAVIYEPELIKLRAKNGDLDKRLKDREEAVARLEASDQEIRQKLEQLTIGSSRAIAEKESQIKELRKLLALKPKTVVVTKTVGNRAPPPSQRYYYSWERPEPIHGSVGENSASYPTREPSDAWKYKNW